ncbi:MAG: hypothetical protein M1821_006029 [Bathelium mastoideum]|nr:MAG: hypothetical protein M1821_006029 [Bathelium mastoideum]KAI9688437.1 MAG: hypothetical protein M1822_001386 [Bathelium mastoideum]
MAPKRKRASTLPKSTLDVVQPSSRDASEEDSADPVLQEVSSIKQRQSDAPNSPAKRARSSKLDDVIQEGRTSPNPASGNTPTRGRPRKSARGSASKGSDAVASGSAENDDDEKQIAREMAPPPKAGLVDPVGYKTNPPPKGRQVRVYADGVFDLFHLGHMRQLEQAKKAFPDTYLLVGVTGDKETHRRKGLTVLSGKERAESIRHCKWVDEVVEDCPWIASTEFLEEHQIDYVAHDDIPYGAAEGDDIYAPIKEQGKFLVTQRTEGVSTTGIITKIVRDHEKYIARQLKRGTSRKELNISWLKQNELELKRHVAEIGEAIRTNWTTTGQELSKDLKQFWSLPSSRAGSPAPGTPAKSAGKESTGSVKSPSAVAHLSHLDVPRREEKSSRNSNDFATGYSLGLIGGVRSWMTRSRRNLSENGPASEGGSDEDSHSPEGVTGEPLNGDPDQTTMDKMDVKT